MFTAQVTLHHIASGIGSVLTDSGMLQKLRNATGMFPRKHGNCLSLLKSHRSDLCLLRVSQQLSINSAKGAGYNSVTNSR